jgi:uncharacterized surface protein with fasciclin (FAS1) repeats
MTDIIDTANSVGNYRTLLSALRTAGWTETLRGPGPYTVFAPDDNAFNRKDTEKMNDLMMNSPMLKAVLTYHVVEGKLMASDIISMKRLTTVEGEELKIDASTWHGHSNPKVTTQT